MRATCPVQPTFPHHLNKQDTNTVKCVARVAVNQLQVHVALRRAQNRNAVMPTAEGHFVLGLCVLHAARRNLLTQNRLFCYAVTRMRAVLSRPAASSPHCQNRVSR